MKKLYFVLALSLLAAFTSQARELKFWIGDTEITPGQTVSYSTVTYGEDFGDFYESVAMAPKLSLSTDMTTFKVMVSAVCTSGQKIQMCAGGLCETGTSITKNDVRVDAGQLTPLQFEWIVTDVDKPVTVPVVTTEFTAQDMTNETTAAQTLRKFTLVMDPNASSLTLIENTDAVSYGHEGINYNVSAPSQLTLYSITGTQVLSTRVEGQGTISTHTLRPGLYIYTLRGTHKVTGKLYVK